MARSGVSARQMMLGNEVDGVGGRHLRRDDEITLVLALLGIDQNEHPAVARILDHFLDRRKEAMVLGLWRNRHGASLSDSRRRAR